MSKNCTYNCPACEKCPEVTDKQETTDTVVEDNDEEEKEVVEEETTEDNTLDKVFLPSYKDYINTSFGFENDVNNVSSSRECKTTDYSRAMGAWSNEESKYLNNGTYWTRSPSSEYKYTSWIVNSAGYLTNYAVDGTSHCVRPAITITLN